MPRLQVCYNVDDLLKVCPQLLIPIVFDWHHHSINVSLHPYQQLRLKPNLNSHHVVHPKSSSLSSTKPGRRVESNQNNVSPNLVQEP